MIRGILFDFDGVIIRSMEDHYLAWKEVFQEYGHQLESHDLFRLEGMGVRSVALHLINQFSIPENELDTIIRRKKEIYDRIKTLALYDGLPEFIDWLKAREFLLGVVTGGDRLRVLSVLEHFCLNDLFSAIVTETDVTHTKPDPEPYLLGASLLGLGPKEVLVIENAPLGIQSAKKAGCTVVGITHTLPAESLQQADFIVSHFSEIMPLIQNLNKKQA